MNAYKVVQDFEKAIAEYTGAPYAVAVESCSAALYLCCKFAKVDVVEIPKFTYPSVASGIINAGGKVRFRDEEWQEKGYYYLTPFLIVDSAKRLDKDMYAPRTLTCLSFHSKKRLKIGRGGMILTDSKEAYDTLKWMRFDGRHECALKDDKLAGIGINAYMTPEQAARGLELFQFYEGGVDKPDEYPDLSQYEFYK